jgi:AAA+ ATPase superfamily predicted ATPase
MQGLKKGKSSTLKECGEEKAKGVLHTKCKSNRREVNSFLSLQFFFFSMVFLFFSFALLEKKKMPRRKHLKQMGQNKRPETGAKSERVE